MSTADLMQPGLVPLQPNLDDLMDYDSIQGRQLFHAHMPRSCNVSKFESEIPKILNSALCFYITFLLYSNRPCFHLSDIVTTRSQGNSVMHFTGNQSMDTSPNTSVRKLCILFRASMIL